MANLLVESFDWLASGLSSTDRSRMMGANTMYPTRGVGPAPPDVTTGRFGYGGALLFNYASDIGQGFVMPFVPAATPATGFIGCGMFVYPDMDPTGYSFIQFYDAVNNVPQLQVRFCANGVVKVYNGTGTLLANSAAGSYQENEWFHIETKATIANGGGGGCEVRINTVPVIQLTGANTQNSSNAYYDSICIGVGAPGSTTLHAAFDDLFANDTTGAQMNTWAGNLRIWGAFMIANGATDNFVIGGTSPAPTNWQSVLNQNLDDTKYVYSPTVGNLDLYTPNPVVNGPLVRVLQIRMALRQDDATQRVAIAQLRIGSTTYNGPTNQYTNQNYTFYKERWQLSPATGTTFTGSEVNGCQVGVKVAA